MSRRRRAPGRADGGRGPAGLAVLLVCVLALVYGCGSSSSTFGSWFEYYREERAAEEARRLKPLLVEIPADEFDSEIYRADLLPRERRDLIKLRDLSEIFYKRARDRRLNSIATFHDPAMREFFQSPEAFADYYADLVQALTMSNFEAIRPTSVVVRNFEIAEGADRVRISVRFRGENGRPGRWWSTSYLRQDEWILSQDRWWIVPGKL
ncbi:MAG: hypothetical protein JRG96_03595 [Deltaproteobacteria bacterium]|nr:hypothetical protein [Deltaproteobacteria bacterium]MBW2417405.1 hypothetical protein [Deltaproteobacteria bacterium]